MAKDFFDSKKRKPQGKDREGGIDELINKIMKEEGLSFSELTDRKKVKYGLGKTKDGRGRGAKFRKPREEGEEESQIGGVLGKLSRGRLKSGVHRKFGIFEKIRTRGEEVVGELLEEGANYKIVKRPEEEIPYYVVFFPKLTEEDKEKLKTIERRAIAEINIDPESIPDKEERWDTFLNEVGALIELHHPEIPVERQHAYAGLIVQDMIGYGLLEPLLNDDNLEEVMVQGVGKSVYVYHRRHGMCRTNIVFEINREITNIIARIARSIGRRVDLTSPLLDARLPDGSRVNATLQPVSLDGASLTIRKFKKEPLSIVDIINFGTITPEIVGFLWLVAEGYGVKPANILISGGTSSGKTTTLNVLCNFISNVERVISIEDTAELRLPLEHWIRLETRPPNIEGRGEIDMNLLLKNVLRMRPDRIIVGEVRGPEAMTLLAAMNTGQNGCLGTLHANTARETVTRLTSEPMNVPTIMIPSLDFILMQNRFSHRGKTVRRITEVAEVAGMENRRLKLNNIYEWNPIEDRLIPTGVPSTLLKEIAELKGISKNDVEGEIERRVKVIRYMVKNDIKGHRNIGRIVAEFHTSPERLLREIDEREESRLDEGTGYTMEEEKVLYEDEDKRIVKRKKGRTPFYIVKIPFLNQKDKETIDKIKKKAIKDIQVDPKEFEDKRQVREMLVEEVLNIIEDSYSFLPFSKRKTVANIVVSKMVGYGLLDFLLGDSQLEDILVVGAKKPIYVNHREYGNCRTNLSFNSDKEVTRVIGKIASSVGRRVDKSKPLLDARLPDGSRVNATLQPVSLDGSTITIRKFSVDPLTVIDLINLGTLDYEVSAYLWLVVEGLGIKAGNVLAAGGASSGKTSTLNVLCSFIPSSERVITIEDTAELTLPVEHVVRLESKPPNVDGEGEITMDDLVKNTLRMRSDRIIVGEVRSSEARTLFTAMNTGHDGCMGTVHSNSASETLVRLTNPPMSVPDIMLPALDLLLMESKVYTKRKTLRRITEVAEVVSEEEGKVKLNYIYTYDPSGDKLKATGRPSVLKQKLAKLRGIPPEKLEGEIKSRERVLKWANKNEIRSIDGLSRIITKYHADPSSFLEEMEIHELNR